MKFVLVLVVLFGSFFSACAGGDEKNQQVFVEKNTPANVVESPTIELRPTATPQAKYSGDFELSGRECEFSENVTSTDPFTAVILTLCREHQIRSKEDYSDIPAGELIFRSINLNPYNFDQNVLDDQGNPQITQIYFRVDFGINDCQFCPREFGFTGDLELNQLGRWQVTNFGGPFETEESKRLVREREIDHQGVLDKARIDQFQLILPPTAEIEELDLLRVPITSEIPQEFYLDLLAQLPDGRLIEYVSGSRYSGSMWIFTRNEFGGDYRGTVEIVAYRLRTNSYYTQDWTYINK